MPKGRCPECEQTLEYPVEMAGREIECPMCERRIQLPDPEDDFGIRVPERPKPGMERRSDPDGVAAVARRVLEQVERVVLGKRDVLEMALSAWLAEGHVLLEDVPGTAKTMTARAFAHSMGGSFQRIQCTPDLLPNDVTGASVFNPRTTEFEFRRGPLFAQIVLADEINRTTPRTQSALLEAMAENKVSVDGTTHDLEPPFWLIATQNPVDHEGTFPLPEAQLDRFLVRLTLGYPSSRDEDSMLERFQLGHPIATLEAAVTPEEIREAQAAVREVHVDPRVRAYLLAVARATREHDHVLIGASPRACLGWFRLSQAWAAIHGFDFVLPDDVKRTAYAVLCHRLILRPESRLRRVSAESVVQEILGSVKAPTIEF